MVIQTPEYQTATFVFYCLIDTRNPLIVYFTKMTIKTLNQLNLVFSTTAISSSRVSRAGLHKIIMIWPSTITFISWTSLKKIKSFCLPFPHLDLNFNPYLHFGKFTSLFHTCKPSEGKSLQREHPLGLLRCSVSSRKPDH